MFRPSLRSRWKFQVGIKNNRRPSSRGSPGPGSGICNGRIGAGNGRGQGTRRSRELDGRAKFLPFFYLRRLTIWRTRLRPFCSSGKRCSSCISSACRRSRSRTSHAGTGSRCSSGRCWGGVHVNSLSCPTRSFGLSVAYIRLRPLAASKRTLWGVQPQYQAGDSWDLRAWCTDWLGDKGQELGGPIGARRARRQKTFFSPFFIWRSMFRRREIGTIAGVTAPVGG